MKDTVTVAVDVPRKCPQCKSSTFTRKVGPMTFDMKGWYQTTVVTCANGHEIRERFSHTQAVKTGGETSRLFGGG